MSDINSIARADKRPVIGLAKRSGAQRVPGKFSIRIRIGEGEASVEKTLFGRFAWTIVKLVETGERGVSSIDEIGPRLAHYVWVLRHRECIAIESIEERHGGQFPGRHVRYRLKSKVAILEGVADAA